MKDLLHHKFNIETKGFTIVDNVYTAEATDAIVAAINDKNSSGPSFRKSADLFAIRQFLKEVPEADALVFNDNLETVIEEFFSDEFFAVKSIYFDKPAESNWFVAYHQDLTISVDKKADLPGFISGQLNRTSLQFSRLLQF